MLGTPSMTSNVNVTEDTREHDPANPPLRVLAV